MAIPLSRKYFEAHRGINDLSPIRRIEDDHLLTLENFKAEPVAEGRNNLEMRDGYTKNTMTSNLTSGTQVQGIHFAEFTGGNETIFAYNSNLYKLGTPPTSLVSGLTDAMFDFTMYNDTLIMANGTDNIKKYTFGGAVADLGGSPPVGTYLHEWHNFIWTAGISSSELVLRWSDVGAIETWSAGNTQDFPYEITGVSSLGDVLYVFGKNQMKTVTGYTTGTLQFNDLVNVGCISHYGIVNNGSSLFWPAQDGIYAIGNIGSTDRVTGGSDLIKLSSEKVRTFWDTLDISAIGQIHGVHDVANHCIRWTVRRSDGTYNDRELVFDYHPNVLGFRTTKGINASSYAAAKSSGEHFVTWGESQTDSNGGILYKLDETATDDDGTAIAGTIESKAYDLDRHDIDKYYHTVSLLAKGGASETDLQIDFGVGDFPDYSDNKTITTTTLPVYGTAVYGTDTYQSDTFKNYGVGINLLGKSLVLKMTTSELNKLIQIAGWSIDAQIMDPITENTI